MGELIDDEVTVVEGKRQPLEYDRSSLDRFHALKIIEITL